MVQISENLKKLTQDLLDELGTKRKVAHAFGVTDSAITDYLQGKISKPRDETLESIARVLTDRTGKSHDARSVLAWMWALPDRSFAGSPVLNLILTSVDDCAFTLVSVKELLKDLASQNRGQERDDMCESLARVLREAIERQKWDLNKTSDYKKFCTAIGDDFDDESSKRLRAIALGKVSPNQGDRYSIGHALQALGDSTPAYELALECQEC